MFQQQCQQQKRTRVHARTHKPQKSDIIPLKHPLPYNELQFSFHLQAVPVVDISHGGGGAISTREHDVIAVGDVKVNDKK